MSQRIRIEVEGFVQGVGFRPFVYLLAQDLRLSGWVRNDHQGATIEIEGPRCPIRRFLQSIEDLPAPGGITRLQVQNLNPTGRKGFTIEESRCTGEIRSTILPDLAPCARCLSEIRDPQDRRFAYPFTNCTHCGPRFSILTALPYDRENTSMSDFALCPSCRKEYEDPTDRRFHAQPIACSGCGPHLEFPTEHAVSALKHGQILALKGVGGFQLLVDATRPDSVLRLRQLKARPDKPLALMVADLEMARKLCQISDEEARLLESPAAPIVLLPKRADPELECCPEVAPGNSYLGLMLPASPLHHLLMDLLKGPVVATSGNPSGDPLALLADEVHHLADLVWDHNRPIAQSLDDSVMMVAAGAPRSLRRARGFAPTPLALPFELSEPVVAVGGQQKVTVSLGFGSTAVVSQHLGDLESPASRALFRETIEVLQNLYGVRGQTVAHDLHPDYFTTMWAQDSGLRCLPVQHHHAHLAAVLVELNCQDQALGVIWDGTGLGPDGTIWGGEFLLGDLDSFQRVAHLAPFPLPGGELCAREPERSAAGLLWRLGRDESRFSPVLKSGRAPKSSSMGRLFDGVAWILGYRQDCTFEGQAAMALENLALGKTETGLTIPYRQGLLHWEEAIPELLALKARPQRASALFHGALIEAAVEVAKSVGCPRVVLSGGCFANRLLLERLSLRLNQEGFQVLLPSLYPVNDGGLSLGQLAVAGNTLRQELQVSPLG